MVTTYKGVFAGITGLMKCIMICAAVSLWGCQGAEDGSDAVADSSAFELPFYDEATFTAKWLKADDVPEDFHALGAFELENQLGQTITADSLLGQINICSFFFSTCPGICPRMMENLKTVVADSLNDSRIQLLSFTAQPSVDSAETLMRYAEDHGIESENWFLVTGPREELYHIGRHQLFIEEDLGLVSSPDEFLHTENVILLDEKNRIRGIYNGLNKASLAYLVSDVKVLLR